MKSYTETLKPSWPAGVKLDFDPCTACENNCNLIGQISYMLVNIMMYCLKTIYYSIAIVSDFPSYSSR